MKLEYVTVKGFKRFEEATTLQTSGKMVAIVGPNEAGKTSLLRAINHLSHYEEISDGEQTYLSSVAPEITAAYFLEESDLKIGNLTQPTWFIEKKSKDGTMAYTLVPSPPRDRTARRQLASAIRQFLRSKSAQKLAAEAGFDPSAEQLDDFAKELEREGVWTPKTIEKFQKFFDEMPDLSGLDGPKYLTTLETVFAETVAFEKSHDPVAQCTELMKKRLPKILMFSEKYRNFEIPYNISLFEHENEASAKLPSLALSEILRIAKLDLRQLKKAASTGNRAAVEGLIQAANENLREASDGVWTQSDATLFLRLDSTLLDVLVQNKSGFNAIDRYVNFADRSDGYKQFIAIQVLAFLEKATDSIILIDEIEQHLHYDGQADLIQMLQNEKSIAKVIYTTHSAGALPEDLGRGVRLVHWDSGNSKISRVTNKFWQDDAQSGFRPLLFGMGAATLAFFPLRKALITEGPTETLLLPQLMREAINADGLDFQIVHGLSSVSPDQISTLLAQGTSACFFLDGDGGAEALKTKLLKAKIAADDIFMVSECGDFSTLEDLLEESVWLAAVNKHIEQFGINVGVTQPIVAAPAKERLKALPDAIRSEKIRFAYNVLEQIEEKPNLQVLSTPARAGLRKLTSKTQSRLGLLNERPEEGL